MSLSDYGLTDQNILESKSVPENVRKTPKTQPALEFLSDKLLDGRGEEQFRHSIFMSEKVRKTSRKNHERDNQFC